MDEILKLKKRVLVTSASLSEWRGGSWWELHPVFV